MKKIVSLISALIVMGNSLLCEAASSKDTDAVGKSQTLYGGLKDFHIQNTDTILTLDCNEFFTDPNTSLFYADFRKSLDLTFDAQLNTDLTEQVFISKEGTRYNPSAGIMVGYDPSTE